MIFVLIEQPCLIVIFVLAQLRRGDSIKEGGMFRFFLVQLCWEILRQSSAHKILMFTDCFCALCTTFVTSWGTNALPTLAQTLLPQRTNYVAQEFAHIKLMMEKKMHPDTLPGDLIYSRLILVS